MAILSPVNSRDSAPSKRAYLRFLLSLFGFIIIVKLFVIDFYRVSSESMSPTFEAGDFVVVWKLPFPAISRGESVIFILPDAARRNTYESGSVFIKRIAGMPGDTVSVAHDLLTISGESTGIPSEGISENLGQATVVIPRKGDEIDIAPESEMFWRPLIERDGHSVVLQNRIVFIDGSPAVSYTFRQNFYFTLGDNFANSFDSRYWGLLPENAITGAPVFIYWSSADDSAVRWHRIGRPAR